MAVKGVLLTILAPRRCCHFHPNMRHAVQNHRHDLPRPTDLMTWTDRSGENVVNAYNSGMNVSEKQQLFHL